MLEGSFSFLDKIWRFIGKKFHNQVSNRSWFNMIDKLSESFRFQQKFGHRLRLFGMEDAENFGNIARQSVVDLSIEVGKQIFLKGFHSFFNVLSFRSFLFVFRSISFFLGFLFVFRILLLICGRRLIFIRSVKVFFDHNLSGLFYLLDFLRLTLWFFLFGFLVFRSCCWRFFHFFPDGDGALSKEELWRQAAVWTKQFTSWKWISKIWEILNL